MKMPSASVEVPEPTDLLDSDPLGTIHRSIEKKIRNLEKRKKKLENYKDQLENGAELEEDQQRAVDAYETVVASICLCKDFCLQINDVWDETIKQQQIQQKKQREKKVQIEFEKIKQMMTVQDILARLKVDQVRSDFLNGTNGAFKLPKEKIQQLDQLCELITPPLNGPERDPSIMGFKDQLTTCANKMVMLFDGRRAPVVNTTYRELRSVISRIAAITYPKGNKQNHKSPTEDHEASKKKTDVIQAKKAVAVGNGKPSSKEANTQLPAPITEDVPTQPPAHITEDVPTPISSNDSETSQQVAKNLKESDGLIVAGQTFLNKSCYPMTKGSDNLLIVDQIALHKACHPTPESFQVPLAPKQDLHNSVLHSDPCIIASSPVMPQEVFHSGLSFFNQSNQQPPPVPMDISDFILSGSFNFLQESQVHPEQSSVYMDPAVVSFGTIKPESLIHMHEQQKMAHSPIIQPIVTPALNNQIGSMTADTFVSQTLPPPGNSFPPATNQPYNTEIVNSNVDSQSTRVPTKRVEEEPNTSPLQLKGSSWADQVCSTFGQNNSPVNNVWNEPLNGEVSDRWRDAQSSSWADDVEDRTYSSDDRRGSIYQGGRGQRRTGTNGYRGRGGSYGYSNGRGHMNGAYGGSGYRARGSVGGFRGSRAPRGSGGPPNPRASFRGGRVYQGTQQRSTTDH